VILTIHTTPVQTVLDLPNSIQFALNPARQQAERISLAGSVIRQVSAFHDSTSRATWSGMVDLTTGEQIQTAYEGSPFCTFDDRGRVYEAVWRPVVARNPSGGSKRAVSIQFDVIRKVY